MAAVVPLLGQIALNAAIGIGASVLANAIRPQRQTQSAVSSRGLRFELTVGESVSVSSIWGRGRTGGQLTFAQEYGDTNQFMKLKIDCGRGWYDALETVIADEEALTLTGSNDDVHGRVAEEYRDAEGNPRVWFKYYTGAPGQTADAGLIAAAPTRWGSSHTATATPYIIVTLSYEPDMFPGNSLPAWGFVWRGLKQYDWRFDSTMPGGAGPQRWNDQSTWPWSENAAVLAWNWRRGHWRNGVRIMGMGFSRYANDLAYFTAAANLCDEELFFEETSATLPRYTFGREIFDDEEHLAVLREFEAAWCGSSFDRAGAYAPVPAAAVTPVLTLEDHHRIDGEPVAANRWGKVSDKKTKIHGSYAPISHLFIPAPYAARINTDLEALTRGPKAQRFDQTFEHRAERAQMRAEIALRRNMFGATRTETFGPVANVLEPGDAVTRNCEWGPTLMIVNSVEAGPDGIGRVVNLTAWDNSIVPDPDDGFLDLPSIIGPLPVAATRTLQVSGFDIDPMQRVTGGNEEPFARATWTAIEDPNCDQVIVKVWPTAIPAEVEEFAADARLAASLIIGPLRPNTAYTGIAQLTRRDLRRTYDTDPVTFTTGTFRPGEIGPGDLTDELNDQRAWATRSPELLRAELEALAGYMMDSVSARIVDQQTIRTEVTARFGATEASFDQKINVVAGELGALSEFTQTLYTNFENTSAEFETQITTISSNVGSLAGRMDTAEVTINHPSTGVAANASGLNALQLSVTEDLAAQADLINALEVKSGNATAGFLLAARVAAAPAGADGAIQLGLRMVEGGTPTWTGFMIVKTTGGLGRIYVDANEAVFTGTIRDITGKTFWNMNTGARRSST